MKPEYNSISRRKFVSSSLMLGATSFIPLINVSGKSMLNHKDLTIQEVIDLIIKEVPGAPFKETVDTVKCGDASKPVTGIVTTMFPTIQVIRQAIERKANFIIVHEPSFYNHLDETSWLQGHDVFQYKYDLLNKNNIVLWRFHDYWHTVRPDGIGAGVLKALGWEQYYREETRGILNIPTTRLKDLVDQVKQKLKISHLKVVGDLQQECKKIGLLPGAMGGRAQIHFMKLEQPDVLMVGEVQEWETTEYFRDLQAMGKKQSLVVLGHSVSEEPGMNWLVEWLMPKIPQVKVNHIPSGDPYQWI